MLAPGRGSCREREPPPTCGMGDVGGGSVELIVGNVHRADFVTSVKLGASLVVFGLWPRLLMDFIDPTTVVHLAGVTGAAAQALDGDANVKLVALGDAFKDRLDGSLETLQKQENITRKIDVPEERRFVGFDAYQQVINACDVVLLCSPPHFRPMHIREAVRARKESVRQAILQAARALVTEGGFRATQMAAVAERAGVSRGAAQHHFPTREDLLLAALRHIVDSRGADLSRRVQSVPEGPGRTEAVVQMVVDAFSGTGFNAALQLWAGAASDPALRERVIPLEEQVGREVHRAVVDLLGADESVPGTREAVQATLDLARGLGLANLLTDDGPRRRRVVRQWALMLDQALAAQD